MAKILNSNVVVDEKWYGPDYPGPIPDDVAERIGAHAWTETGASESPSQQNDEEPKSVDQMTKGELVDKLDELRSSGVEIEVAAPGNKPELIEALRPHLEG